MDSVDLSDPRIRKAVEDAAVHRARRQLGFLIVGLVALGLLVLPIWLLLIFR